jgi:hypothetical protein
MIKDNSYFYTIQEIIVNRKSDQYKTNKEPHHYLQLIIKHRLQKTTLVVFTKSIPYDNPKAFEDLLELAKKMKATY